eukprot:EG_transcript_2506
MSICKACSQLQLELDYESSRCRLVADELTNLNATVAYFFLSRLKECSQVESVGPAECDGVTGMQSIRQIRAQLHQERAAIAEMLEKANLEALSQAQKARGNYGKMLQHLKEGEERLRERRAELAQAQEVVLRAKEDHTQAVAQLNGDREELTALQLAFVREKEEFEERLQREQEKEKSHGTSEMLQRLQDQKELCNQLELERDGLRRQLLELQGLQTGALGPPQEDVTGREAESLHVLVKAIEEGRRTLQAEMEAMLRDSDLVEDFTRLEQLVSSLQQEKDTLQQELSVATAKLKEESLQPNTQGDSDMQKLERLVERLQAEMEELETKLTTALGECQSLKQELDAATSKVEQQKWQAELEHVQRELATAREEVGRMQAERLKAEADREELCRAMLALEQGNAALRSQVDTLEREKATQVVPPVMDNEERSKEVIARLRAEKGELEAKLQLALAEQQALRQAAEKATTLQAQVATLGREKSQLTTALEAATKFGEVCQAACSRREQETKLLTTALGEANRRFEVLGCRRIQPADYEEPAGVRSHLSQGFVAGLRNGTKWIPSLEGRRPFLEEMTQLSDSSASQHPSFHSPEALHLRASGSPMLPNGRRASDLSFRDGSPSHLGHPHTLLAALELPTRPPPLPSPNSLLNASALEQRVEEQFKDTYITLGYLVHIKLSFQAADTDRQGRLDMAKLGNWCLQVGYVDITFSHLKAMIDQVDLGRTQTVSFWQFFAIQSYLHLNLRAKGFALQQWLRFVVLPSDRPTVGPPLPPAVVSPIRPADAGRLRASATWT